MSMSRIKQDAPAQLALSEGGSDIYLPAGVAHESSGGAA